MGLFHTRTVPFPLRLINRCKVTGTRLTFVYSLILLFARSSKRFGRYGFRYLWISEVPLCLGRADSYYTPRPLIIHLILRRSSTSRLAFIFKVVFPLKPTSPQAQCRVTFEARPCAGLSGAPFFGGLRRSLVLCFHGTVCAAVFSTCLSRRRHQPGWPPPPIGQMPSASTAVFRQ